LDVLEWYGIDLSLLASDAAQIEIGRTHTIGFRTDPIGNVQLPLALDPGLDLKRTSYLSRMIQRWGRLPLVLLNGLDLKDHRYAFIGTEDWSMHPLIPPGSLVLIDETKRRIQTTGWNNEGERPVYFLEHRAGYIIGWCSLNEGILCVQPHPASESAVQVFSYPDQIDVIGQVVGMATRLDPGRKRRTRS
jgi:hypothetical protein